MKKLIRSLIVFLALIIGNHLVAQNSDSPKNVTEKYIITDVYIVKSPDHSPVMGDIVIENGLITKVGPGVTAPFDAMEIKGDSMYAYPAFIDALSHSGLPKGDDKQERPRVKDPGNPPDDIAGILPGRMVSEMIEVSEKSFKDHRKNGFGAVHTVPKGNMLPGRGAVLLTQGSSTSEAIVKDDASVFSQFSSSPRMFPATVIGVMAKWRDLYNKADAALKYENKYKLSSAGMARPGYSKTITSMYPVVDKSQSVFFKTPKSLDIHRALSLQEELGFAIILSELRQGWRVADEIKRKNLPVLLSMKLPKAEKKKEEKKEKEKKEEDGEKKEVEKKEEEKVDEETKKFKERKSKSIKEYEMQAAAMEKAGIAFGFSFLDGKHKDTHANVRRMIEAGLSEKAALKALTTYPAELLGISNVLGTLEQGKIANILLTTKPYFDEKSKIKCIIVDGVKEEYEVKEKKKKSKSDGEGGGDISGEWEYTVESPMSAETQKMEIEKADDGSYTITLEAPAGGGENIVVEGVVPDGDNVSFSFDMKDDGFSMTIAIDVEVDGDTMEGTATAGEFGSFPLTGKKVSPNL